MEEVPEGKETTVQRPCWTSDWHLRSGVGKPRDNIALTPAQNGTLSDGLLTGVGFGIEVLDSGLGNPVQETKTEESD